MTGSVPCTIRARARHLRVHRPFISPGQETSIPSSFTGRNFELKTASKAWMAIGSRTFKGICVAEFRVGSRSVPQAMSPQDSSQRTACCTPERAMWLFGMLSGVAFQDAERQANYHGFFVNSCLNLEHRDDYHPCKEKFEASQKKISITLIITIFWLMMSVSTFSSICLFRMVRGQHSKTRTGKQTSPGSSPSPSADIWSFRVNYIASRTCLKGHGDIVDFTFEIDIFRWNRLFSR